MKRNFNWQYKKGFGPLAILLVVAVVLVLGGGVYYTSHHPRATVEESAESSATANVSLNTKGSLRSLLAMGKDLMCTFSSATTSGSVTGTMYVSGPMMRGDFTSTSQNSGAVESHMIRNGDLAYAWTGSQGAKMSFSDVTSGSAQAKSNVNLDESVDYKCSNWTVDSSKFSVPTNVTFTDISAMMHGSMQGSGGGASAGGNMCTSLCATLSGDAKTQCMAAYNCK